MAHRKQKKEIVPKHHKREIQRLERRLSTEIKKQEQASDRAVVHLHAFQVTLDRERSKDEKLSAATARIAELEDLVAAYEQNDEEERLMTEKPEALRCEEVGQVEEVEKEQSG